MSQTERRSETTFDPYAEDRDTSGPSAGGDEGTEGLAAETQPASAREAIARATAALGDGEGQR